MTNHLKEENSKLKTELEKLNTRLDGHAQREEHLSLMHGVQESVDENTLVLYVINNGLGVPLNEIQIMGIMCNHLNLLVYQSRAIQCFFACMFARIHAHGYGHACLRVLAFDCALVCMPTCARLRACVRLCLHACVNGCACLLACLRA